MSVLRDLGSKLLGASLLDWLAAGAGSGGTRNSQTQPENVLAPRLEDETDAWFHTERDREIELRVLLSTWM